MARSTYFYYRESKHLDSVSRRRAKDEEILAAVRPVFEENSARYGYRRVIMDLVRKGVELGVGTDRIRKVMSRNGLLAFQRKSPKYRSYKGDNGMEKRNLLLDSVYDEDRGRCVLKRDFSAEGPNRKWTTDVSEFRLPEGKIYLSPVLDMYDSSIVAYDISRRPDFSQTRRMVDAAFSKFGSLDGLIFHSDQGWQYQMREYGAWLAAKGVRQSFSRKGNCMDNSLMENFFGILKNEMFYGREREFKSLDDLREAIEAYIEYYNNRRINAKRGGLTPLEYRQNALKALE